MALVVALILLVVITLLGLAAVGGTILQNKMAANQYDRQIAFQSAEAALRVAQQSIPLAGNPANTRDCQITSGVDCPPDPFTAANLQATEIQTVTMTDYQPGNNASGQPQYVIEYMGLWTNYKADLGYGQTANSHNVPGGGGATTQATYYRITARSGDPSVIDERAVVTLQAIVKRS